MKDLDQHATRIAQTVTGAVAAGYAGTWMAFRLSDAGTDGVHYASRVDAIRHQLHHSQCAYVRVPYDQMTAREAATVLRHTRQAYDAGYRQEAPQDWAHELIIPGGR